MKLETALRTVLEESGRGIQTHIASNTDLHQSEIANWLRGQRPLPPRKLIQAIDYLIGIGVVSVELEITRRAP